MHKDDQTFIDEAVRQAESKTSAKITVVVLPASGAYKEYILAGGFITGTAAALTLWAASILHDFPVLLAVQIGILALCDLTGIGRLFIRLAPRAARRHFAAEMAMRQYHALHADKNEPFVLLFVSLAERYVHIVTNPAIHARLPGEWDKITNDFTQDMRQKGLRTACGAAVERIAARLAASFPA
ncbi:MAG: hypothetical protein P4M15_05140 [Alphaproteobacteria bacterium]|nr:hypothetical protein [Alphaproteobacteria bacterium]